MICRRAAAAGIATKLGNHSFRATGSRPISRTAARSKRPCRNLRAKSADLKVALFQ
jgi:hypothetical protein